MDPLTRTEQTLAAAVAAVEVPGSPPRLGAAIRHAVFPRGARIRPRLCLSVARACGDDAPELANAAGAAIELLHCASLVHDDLPCFDDADIRRGKPSVHKAFGEPLAVLTGDAMIVMAFEIIARAGATHPARLAPVLLTIARSVGAPVGITAGQAWECEPAAVLRDYQRAKTGSLFVAATIAGAAAAGADPTPWQAVGEQIGEAYQVADDIRDAVADEAELGKPINQDIVHARPNAVHELGLNGAVERLQALVAGSMAAIPDCPGAGELQALIMSEAKRLKPKKLDLAAA